MNQDSPKCRCGCGGVKHIHSPWTMRHGLWCQFLDSISYKSRGNTTLLGNDHKGCGSPFVHPELPQLFLS